MATQSSLDPTASTPRLRVVPAPRWDPPDRDDAAALNRPVDPCQDTLPLGFCLPNGLPTEPALSAFTLLPAARQPYRDAEYDDDDGPIITSRAQLPDPVQWAGRLSQGIVEVCGGGRPVTQLLRWCTPAVFGELLELRRTPSSRDHKPTPRFDQVRSVHVCEPADGVAEASVVIAGRQRWWALALRFEGLNGRWVLTRLEFI